MKKLIAILFLLSTTAHADIVQKGNNEMIKECLDVYGFDKTLPVEQRLNTFDWRSASGCVSNFVVEKQQKKVAKQKEFLDQNPWFKGKNEQNILVDTSIHYKVHMKFVRNQFT